MKYLLIVFIAVLSSRCFAQDVDSAEIRRLTLRDIDSMKKVLTLRPEDDSTLLSIADSDYNIQMWPEAQTYYEAFINRNPNEYGVRIDYSVVLGFTTGSRDRSIEQLSIVLAHDPENVRALYDMGLDQVEKYNHTPRKAISDALPYLKHALSAARKEKDYEMYGKICVYIAQIEDIMKE